MNVTVKIMLKLIVLLSLFTFVLPVSGELIYHPTLENQRNPNDYCAKCHKFDANSEQFGGDLHFGKFNGIHLSKSNPATGKQITCISCHGNISEKHRLGTKDVMRFESDIFNKKTPMFSVEEQNQVCFSCHQPDNLREKFWAHDVHAMKLPCAACHSLHQKEDPVQKLEKKSGLKYVLIAIANSNNIITKTNLQ